MEMEIRIQDLREYLAQNQISPITFAESVGLSHMTIRRWLKRPDNEVISRKYHAALAPILGLRRTASEIPQMKMAEFGGQFSSFDVDTLMKEVERAGSEFKDTKTLEKDLKSKIKGTKLGKIYSDHCLQLIKAAKSKKVRPYTKAICVGALLYFISPIDLIPDYVPGLGYIDDLAVLSMAINVLVEKDKNWSL